jgi:hypothetical protein
MESKKINQLATELTPALDDLTIIGDPTTGISKKITLSQMASLFTGTVEEYANLAAFPLVGVADTIYIALDTNVLYRWDTSTNAYVELSPNIINSLVFSDANGFDGNISLVGSVATLTITTALTTGSVPFIGASGALSQDNANLFFDDTNNRLGINTNAPTTALDVFGSGIIGRLNGTSTNNAFLGFANAGTNKWSIGNVQSDHRFRIYNEATTSELVSVLQTGEFGVGIANPTTKVHIDGGATALIANLDANVSVAKSISFRSDNSNRINLEVSGTESGSNAGADFFLRAYSDAGALLNTPLTITRATGAATFVSSVTASNGILIGGAGTRTDSFIPKFSGTTSVENSVIYQGATGNILIGNTATDSGNVLQVRKDQASPTRLEISNANASGVTTLIFKDATESKGFLEYTNSSNSLALYNVKSGALVLGTNNTTALTLASSGAATFANLINTKSDLQLEASNSTNKWSLYTYTDNSFRMNYNGAGNDEIVMASNGAFGVKVTPSAWGTNMAALQIGSGGVLNNFTGANNNFGVGVNFYDNGAGSQLRIYTGGTGKIDFSEDILTYANAGSNSAGTSISFVERLRIHSGGAVSIKSGVQPTGNGLHFYFQNDISTIASLEANVAWRPMEIRSSQTTFDTNGTERMRIQTNGVLKIGNGQSPDDGQNPGYKNVGIAYNVSGDYGEIQAVQQGINVQTLRLNNAGGGVYAGSVRLDTLSDERMKRDIEPLENTLEIIKQLNPKKFYLIDEKNPKLRYGFIAQELEGVLDDFVYNSEMKYKDEETGYEVENIKGIENWASSWSALIIKGMQEQQTMIEKLKAEVAFLKAK